MFIIDRTAHNNRLKNRHPAEKALLALPGLGLALLAHTVFPPLALFIAATLSTVLWAKVSFRTLGRVFMIPLGFILISCISIIVTVNDEPFSALGISSIGPLYIGITASSLRNGLLLLCKAAGGIACFYFFALTTPMGEINRMLIKIHVPKIIRELMTIMYRFIFIFTAAAKTIHTAQRARRGYGTMRNSFRSLSMLTTTVFLKSYAFSNRSYQALLSRGYDGEFIFLQNGKPPSIPLIISAVGIYAALYTATLVLQL